MGYWEERLADTQARLTQKGIKATEKQIMRYYQRTMNSVIGQFETIYDKVFLGIEEGVNPTPADLYKLNTYWQLQGQLKQELNRLGDRQAALLSSAFMNQYRNIFNSIALNDDLFFSEIDYEAAEQIINSIWCADGKNWSSRIWGNTEALQQELNDSLIECLVAGRDSKYLKEKLMERFGVSYNKADNLVRTEMAHIQVEASRQRYLKSGITEVEVLADEDERRCKVCGKLHQKRFPIGGNMPIPAHSKCRCCLVPVIE